MPTQQLTSSEATTSSSKAATQLHSIQESKHSGRLSATDSVKRDAPMATSKDNQISFRVDPDLKRQFELALVYRSVRQERKATAVEVMTEKMREFIQEENKLRQE